MNIFISKIVNFFIENKNTKKSEINKEYEKMSKKLLDIKLKEAIVKNKSNNISYSNEQFSDILKNFIKISTKKE